MVPLVGFFVAGFFWPVWPMGLLAAFVIQALAMLMAKERYVPWYYRSKAQLAQILAAQMGIAVALHGAVMGLANLIRSLI